MNAGAFASAAGPGARGVSPHAVEASATRPRTAKVRRVKATDDLVNDYDGRFNPPARLALGRSRSKMTPMWRAEDRDLLARLEDELVLERLFRHQAGDHAGSAAAVAAGARAAGMIALVRSIRPDAVAKALAGDVEPLARELSPERLDVLPSALLHHLALHHATLADALGGEAPPSAAAPRTGPQPDGANAGAARDRGRSSPARAVEARLLSVACWLALGEDGGYLASLARAVVAGALPDAAIERAVAAAPLAAIEELGRVARAGAREQLAGAKHALMVLERVDAAVRRAGASARLGRLAKARADAHRAAAADEALAPVLLSLSEAAARGELLARGPELFARTAAVWRWAGEDELVEQFAVEQATPIAWDHYRDGRWDDLRALLAPVEPLVERLAGRIEADPTRIAYAGPCAQMFVFRSESDKDAGRRLALAERSVRICPTHRNGRLILANLLCDAALDAVKGATSGGAAADRAQALVDRAEKLYPACKRLDDARARIADARRRAGWAAR